jgi:hypothetical protein
MAYALLTPAAMGMYWWLALQSIRSRQYHLHMVYSVLLVTATSSAGGLRYLFQYFYATSQCEPFRSLETSIVIQSVSLATVPIFYIPLVTIIYCTLPLESRSRLSNISNQQAQGGRPTVQWSYFFYIGHALTTLVVSGWLGVPSSVSCHPLPRDDSMLLSYSLAFDSCNHDSSLDVPTNIESFT